MKTTVIYHSGDYDGIFCREIARKFMPDAELIGWNFGNKVLPYPSPDKGIFYVLDLPCDQPFGQHFYDKEHIAGSGWEHFVWIDHHKSTIESHPKHIPGYRIDGVAACRLAWQWFHSAFTPPGPRVSLPTKADYVNRLVAEPLAIRLAGEYDIWDHRGDGDLEFQFGMDSVVPTAEGWSTLLSDDRLFCGRIIEDGRAAMNCYTKRDADIMRERSFVKEWEGLKFLCLNTARCNSNTFAASDVPETGHDALLAFCYNGKTWTVSLYHAKHRTDLDLSAIAVKHGGGGHRGACGFTCKELAFI